MASGLGGLAYVHVAVARRGEDQMRSLEVLERLLFYCEIAAQQEAQRRLDADVC